MTIKVDTDQFLFDSIDRIFKQVHLNDNYDIGIFQPSDIPADVKKYAKGITPPDFFNGTKSKVISLRAINPSESKDDDKIKIANFIKTTFFLTDDSEFSSNDVYQVKVTDDKKKKKDDNEEDADNVKAIFFFIKMDLTK